MRCREPLKQILTDTRAWWDRPETRPAVRENFGRMINCKTQVRRNSKAAVRLQRGRWDESIAVQTEKS